jgi:hypothetical protein
MSDEELKSKNGWGEWSKHVLIELERLNKNYSSLSDELQKVQIELATIKEKATIFGALSGAVVLAIGMGVQFLKNSFGS